LLTVVTFGSEAGIRQNNSRVPRRKTRVGAEPSGVSPLPVLRHTSFS